MSAKLYFISGVCGIGKSSLIPHLKNLLSPENYDVHDLDERGVPDGGGKKWHDAEVRYWIDIGNKNATNNISTIVCGFAEPEAVAQIKQPSDLEIELIMLDASDDTLRSRLSGRHSSKQSIAEIERASGIKLDAFIDKMITDTPLIRNLFEKYNYPIVNTDNKTPAEISKHIIEYIL